MSSSLPARALAASARRLWASGYQDWLPISTHWEGIANKLALAIEINGAERAEMIADEAFANSYCPGCSMPLRKIAHNPSPASFLVSVFLVTWCGFGFSGCGRTD
jgi:hypothetical protein